MRTLILYAFHELTSNVERFIRRGIIDCPEIVYIFIYNQSINSSIDIDWIHRSSNVHLLIRPNTGLDFEGWNTALFAPASSLVQKIIRPVPASPYLYTQFDRFICMNSTLAGPYVPSYVPLNWVDCFLSKLSEEIKLVGVSANFLPHIDTSTVLPHIVEIYGVSIPDVTHIQSMIFGVDRSGLDILLKYKLFWPNKSFPVDKWKLICTSEIAMSGFIRREKKSIHSYMVDQGTIKYNQTGLTDDKWYQPGTYPLYETMFVKTTTGKVTFLEQDRYDLHC